MTVARFPALLVVVLLVLAAPARASYEEGMTAWERYEYRTALVAFERAAEAGDPRAQDRLGMMHEDGQGTPPDDASAAYWYRKAAEQGYAPAQFNLGRMYRNGRGVEQDQERAVHWYRQASEQGMSVAQFFLGLMYDTGKGVPEDPITAYMWFSLAAAQGDKDALFKRDRIAKQLTPEEIGRAREMGKRYGTMEVPVSVIAAARRPPVSSRKTAPAAAPPAGPDAVEAAPPRDPGPPEAELARDGVRAVQRLLRERGYDPGPVDGLLGRRTRDAARAFQQGAGLETDGRVTRSLLVHLRAPPSPAAAPPVAAAPAMSPEPLRNRSRIREAQRRLAAAGHDPGPVDGLPGSRTRVAVRSYQRSQGLQADGKLTVGLLARLRAPAAPARETAPPAAAPAPPEAPPTRDLVRRIQRRLARLGYEPGPADGLSGRRTRAAVEAFQRDTQAAVDGRLTRVLLRNLRAVQVGPARPPPVGIAPPVPVAVAPAAPATRPPPPVVSPAPAAPTPAPAAAPPPPPGGELGGQALVREIQVALDRLGYDPGVADGVIGRRTIDAAKAFQREFGQRATGTLSARLLRLLRAAADRGRLSREVVRQIQSRLTRLGYQPGPADGLVGDRTTSAVKAFQRAAGLSPDGRLSPALLERIKQASS